MIFDAHFHIIDPRFPLVANDGFLPEPFDVTAYRARTAHLGISGGAVVSGSFQAFDQSYLLDALTQLGPGFVGVTQLPASVTDAEILALAGAGVRALRFNVRRGGSEALGALQTFALRVHELAGWHVELYIDAAQLGDLADVIAALPAVSIDHLGLSRAGLDPLLALVDRGVMVKATGFGRVDLDVTEAVTRIAAINPAALMFGTDLPSTRARRPFADSDIELLSGTLGVELADAVLRTNAERFYRIAS